MTADLFLQGISSFELPNMWLVNVVYSLDDAGQAGRRVQALERAPLFDSVCEGMDIPNELEMFKFARQKVEACRRDPW
jgi:hypothetical protein